MELLHQSVYTCTVLMGIATLCSTEFLGPFTLPGQIRPSAVCLPWRWPEGSGLAGTARGGASSASPLPLQLRSPRSALGPPSSWPTKPRRPPCFLTGGPSRARRCPRACPYRTLLGEWAWRESTADIPATAA